MANVVLLKGMSQYGALRLHIDQAAEGFRTLGYNPVILDFSDDNWRYVLSAMKGPAALIFSLSILAETRFDGKTLAELIGAPHCVLHVDHPGWHLKRLEQTPREAKILTLDSSHSAFIENWFGKGYFSDITLIPPAANRLTIPQDADADDFVRRRDIPVLFTGTFRGVPQPQWRDMASSPAIDLFKKVFDVATDMASADDVMPAEVALDMACMAIGIAPDHPMTREVLRHSFWLSEYMHSVRRFDALKTLAKAGVPVHIYGNGFDGQMYRFKSFTYGGVGSFMETLSLIQRSRLVLNTNTHFVQGAHERTFAAMAGGAATVSDVSTYYRSTFKDGEAIALYRWTKPDSLSEKVTDLLDNPEKAFAMGRAGQNAVEQGHMWQHRAEAMLRLVGCAPHRAVA